MGVWRPVVALLALMGIVEGATHFFDLSHSFDLAGDVLQVGAVIAGGYVLSTYISKYVARLIRRKDEEVLQEQQRSLDLERRFHTLIGNNPNGIVLLSAEGTFLYASPSAGRLTGYAPEDLLGRSGFELVHPEDRGGVEARFGEAIENPGRTVRLELRLRHRDGSWRWHEAAITNLLADPSIRAAVVDYRDLTERNRAEAELRAAREALQAAVAGRERAEEAVHRAREESELRVRQVTEDLLRAKDALQAALGERERVETALRESHAQLAGIFGAAPKAIITIDEEQRIVQFNTAAERSFGVSAAEVMGQSMHRFIPPRFRPTQEAGTRDFERMKLERWWIGDLGHATAVRADGEEFPIEVAVSEVEVGGRKLCTIILHDIHERQQAEEEHRTGRAELRALAGRLLSVQEQQRSWIAKQLHDELGQALTALKMDLVWLATRLPVGQWPPMEKVRAMTTLFDSTIRLARRLVTELRPGVLDDLGLVAALEWLTQEFESRTGIRCEFTSDRDEVVLNADTRAALFRICQEALTNVTRHARAGWVRVSLCEEAGSLILTVADNGRGISEQESARRSSLGLLGIRERALLLGGRVTIVGRRGEGTTVTVRVPLTAVSPVH